MFNDKLGQISLEREDRKNKQVKKRNTQNPRFYKNANSYSLKPSKRNAYNIVSISADDHFINYSNGNPANDVTSVHNQSYGETIYDKYEPYLESKNDPKERHENMNVGKDTFYEKNLLKTEHMNGKYDVLKRDPITTNFSKNYPFPNEDINAVKVDSGDGGVNSNLGYSIVSNIYERVDSKDPFVDNQSFETRDRFYIYQKNYYNNGKISSFLEKDTETVNSISSERSNEKHFKTNEFFSATGFVYKSNRPDSIAFGGLKR